MSFFIKKIIFESNLSSMEQLKTRMNFGEYLRSLRVSAGLTLKEVATTIRIDSSLLAKIERNQRQPTKHLIKSLASFFKKDEKELLTEFLSDRIAYKILDEEGDLNILKVAEEKLSYFKTLSHSNEYDKK